MSTLSEEISANQVRAVHSFFISDASKPEKHFQLGNVLQLGNTSKKGNASQIGNFSPLANDSQPENDSQQGNASKLINMQEKHPSCEILHSIKLIPSWKRFPVFTTSQM
jgi:hypothetical protein